MTSEISPIGFTVILLAGMTFCLALGRWLGAQHRRDGSEAPGVSTIDGALFGLFGLVIAFTFSGAVTRFETRRDLIREEANDIGTAYLRLDLLPAARQPALRQDFRDYVQARLESLNDREDAAFRAAGFKRVNALQNDIWTKAVSAAAEVQGPQATTLLLPAINDVIDITTTHAVAEETHPPLVIYGMLAVLAWASSLNAGFGMAGAGRRSMVHIVGFVAGITLSSYVILDLEYPRSGLFRISAADHVIRDAGAAMGPR
jgi:hypothetical protein